MPSKRPFVVFVLLSALTAMAAPAAEVELPPKDAEPVLRIDPGAPAAFVTSLAFSPDGKTLYAGGWDKVIRGWTLNDKGRFEPSRTVYRVPIGPGLDGAINALALSPDGLWLAAAGNGTSRQLAGFRQEGFIVPASGVRDPIMLRDVGTIYLFNTQDQTVRMLRGHQGAVRSLTFGPKRTKGAARLLSVAEEEQGTPAAETRLAARLWDLDKAESLAELTGLPTKSLLGRRPGVALWHSGDGADEVTAALALYDGNLRIWNPAQKQEQPQRIKDLPHNLNLAVLPGRNGLLTAGYNLDRNRAQLTQWQFPAEGEPEPTRCNTGDGLIRDVSLVSRKGDGTPDLAALVVLQGRSPLQFRLRLVNLGKDEFGHIEGEELLWEVKDILQPTVATSLRGKHVAVAGNQGHDIRVYTLDALLRKKAVTPQIIRGATLTFQHASFVRRGKAVGLLLNPRPRKKAGEPAPAPDGEQGDWIFDFGKRRLTDNVAGWEAAIPQADGWRAKDDGAKTIAVHNGDKPIREISIPSSEAFTDYALLPPGEAVTVPLLAVATHERGQPRLAVYNAKSGEKLRVFTGHKERLRSLAFSADGRLLVSAGIDGNVCVWSLTDLPSVLGRRGQLPGVSVEQAKGAVAVRAIETDSAAHGKLKPGDILAGLVEKGKLRRLASPRAFYEAIYLLKPGGEVVLRRGDAEGNDDVTLVVGQGIDERKPLFSLFVSRADKAADSEWIGWSPLGPYESSSPRAEKYLGWHFNTGELGAPTRFASADQYRKFYYREGILNKLIERGTLDRVEALELPPPTIALWVEEKGQVLAGEARAPVLVQQPQVAVKVTLLDRPLTSLSSLSWQLDGGKETPLELDRSDGVSFAVPVSLSRGEHRFVVTARTQEAPLQPLHESLRVRYRPAAPEVMLKDAGGQLFVRKENFTLNADIKPKLVGEKVRVTLNHRHDEGEEKPHSQSYSAEEVTEGVRFAFERRLRLRPGNNAVEVVAVNDGASGDGKEETSRRSLEIFYIFKAKPPLITFRQVVPLSEHGNEGSLPADTSRRVVVRLPMVKLDGIIKAGQERLTEAVWDRGKGTSATPLRKFEPGKDTDITFEEKIALKPGVQTLRFRARTKNSDEAERSLTLEYQPPVPVVSITEPPSGLVLDGKEETKTVRVRGKMVLSSSEARDYKAVLLINGKPASASPFINEKAGTLDGVVLVGPGESRIQVRLSNAWGTVGHSEEVAIRYLRPPIIHTLKHAVVANKPLLNLTTEVFSPIPLKRELVTVKVNGQESAANEIQIERGEKNLWTVRVQGVPLDAGSRQQKIVLSVSNAEAECRVPATLSVESATVLPAPEVDFLEPRQNMSVSTPRVTISFQVRSEGALERVHLLRQGQPDQPIDLAGVRREGGRSELTVTREVDLRPGLNMLSVAAVSVSGRRPDSPRLILNYVPPPLRVEIDHFTKDTEDGASVRPEGKDRRGFVFPEASSGQVWLHGHIHWADRGQGTQEDYFLLRVFVNGFQQAPVYIQRKPTEVKKTPFRALLLLNRAKGNHVILVAFQQDSGGNAECTMDCAAPITRQRLYILALSANSRPDELQGRILKAINSRRAERKERETAFKDVYVYPPLTGFRASPHFLNSHLATLDAKMQQEQKAAVAAGKPMNDVLMIYFEGGETINEDGHFFETRAESGKEDPFGMPCDKLVGYLGKALGAHILLLDVDRPTEERTLSRDKIKTWEKSYPDILSHVVVMRCAHRGTASSMGETRLLPVLQRTIPQANRLRKLVELVEEVIARSNDATLLVFKSYVPIELADLMLGSPP